MQNKIVWLFLIANGRYCKAQKENKVGRIEFFHPKGNSLTSEIMENLVSSLNKAEGDSDINVIIIESIGQTTFCSGASLSEIKSIKNIESGINFFMGFARLLNTIRQMSKFVLARVHGKIVGGGVGLVSACDYSFALKIPL